MGRPGVAAGVCQAIHGEMAVDGKSCWNGPTLFEQATANEPWALVTRERVAAKIVSKIVSNSDDRNSLKH
jgi:hypothetical protein